MTEGEGEWVREGTRDRDGEAVALGESVEEGVKEGEGLTLGDRLVLPVPPSVCVESKGGEREGEEDREGDTEELCESPPALPIDRLGLGVGVSPPSLDSEGERVEERVTLPTAEKEGEGVGEVEPPIALGLPKAVAVSAINGGEGVVLTLCTPTVPVEG